MTKLKTTPFDAAQYITEPEDVLDLLNDAFRQGEAGYITAALGVAARSEGMSRLAAETGVNRQALYTALSESGNPTLDTLLKVLAALDIHLRCEAGAAKAA